MCPGVTGDQVQMVVYFMLKCELHTLLGMYVCGYVYIVEDCGIVDTAKHLQPEAFGVITFYSIHSINFFAVILWYYCTGDELAMLPVFVLQLNWLPTKASATPRNWRAELIGGFGAHGPS